MLQRLRDNKRGFTLIELMIVIAIIGILAAVAVPNFIAYRKHGYDISAKSDAVNAYTVVLSYYSTVDITGSTSLSLADLGPLGFKQSPSVTVTLTCPNSEDFTVVAKHNSGVHTYSIDATGAITES